MTSENLSYVGKWTIKFGKHKGKTYDELVSCFPGYVEWLLAFNVIKNEKVVEYLHTMHTPQSA